MSTYVMSDIHGCYDALHQMMKQIGLTAEDRLIIAGDYIDRGPQNYEMLQWLLDPPSNVTLIKGNHDDRFVIYVGMLKEAMEREGADFSRLQDTRCIHQDLVDSGIKPPGSGVPYDFYGTIGDLIRDYGTSLNDLLIWSEAIDRLPLFFREEMNGRDTIVVHGGYVEELELVDTKDYFENRKMFLLWAREDAYSVGGVPHGMVIAGHTPTFFDEFSMYNDGFIYRKYDEEKDCIYYDIDCGYVYRDSHPEGELACLRLEDEAEFYLEDK